jgi:hypothetical protein
MKVVKIPILNGDTTKFIQPLFYKFDNAHLLLRYLICNSKVKTDYRFKTTPILKKPSTNTITRASAIIIPQLQLSRFDKEETNKIKNKIIDGIVSANNSNAKQEPPPEPKVLGPNIEIIEPNSDVIEPYQSSQQPTLPTLATAPSCAQTLDDNPASDNPVQTLETNPQQHQLPSIPPLIPPPPEFSNDVGTQDRVDMPPEDDGANLNVDLAEEPKDSLFKEHESDFYVDLTEREELKAHLDLLKTITNIPIYNAEMTSTDNLRQIVRVTRKRCLIKERTESIRNYIKAFLIGLEFICTQCLSINLSGFAARECEKLENYNSYVIDLSKRTYLKPSGPVEMRLFKDIVVNAVGYHNGAGAMGSGASTSNMGGQLWKKISKFIVKKP